MANKDNVDLGSEDLDDLDFGDLDFNDPFTPSDGGRTPVESFKDSAVSAVRDRMLDKGLLRRLVTLALPKGYSQAFNAYDALDGAAADILKDNAAELQPYMRKMNLKLTQMSPALRRALPKSVQDALEASEHDDYQSSQGPDELTSNIAGLDKLFAQQADDKIKAEFRDAVKDTRENKRFATEMDALNTMGRGIGRLVGYQDKVTINYQRKSLELKYRHIDISIRTLKAQQEFFSASKQYLDGIQKNTGLPDFVKMRAPEVLKQQLTQRLAAGAMRTAGNFTANYFNNIKTNASQLVGSALQLHRELGDGEAVGQTRAQLFGTMLGSLAGEGVSGGLELLAGTLADKAAPYVEKIPGVSAGGNWLRKNLTGIPQRLNEFAKSDTEQEGLLGLGVEGLKSLLDRHSPTSTITGGRLTDLDKPAIFDNMFYQSVTNVIPSFLASMDRKLGVLATGEDQEEQAFSFYSGSLTSRSDLNKAHVRIALKDNNGQGIRAEVDAILREMNANDLSVDAKRALRRQLLKDMLSANDFKPERYIKVSTWNTVPEEIAEELIDFFADTFGLDPAGKVVDDSAKTRTLTQDVRQKFIELTDRLPDYGGRMDTLQSVVGRRSWRELGLSRYNGGSSDVINMDALNDLIVNEGDEKDLSKIDDEKMPKFTGSIREKAMQRAEWERRRLAKNRKDEGADKDKHETSTNAASTPNRPVNIDREALRRGVVSGPVQVDANVQFPDLMLTSDRETHERLDAMLDYAQQNNQWLEYILEASLAASHGGGEGGPAPEMPQMPDITAPAGKRKSRFSVGRILKGGLFGAARGLGSYFKFTYGTIGKGLGLGGRAAGAIVGGAFKGRQGLGVTDIYLRGQDVPVMTARDLRRGLYLDMTSKKIIEKIPDITGPVQRVDNNEVVLTQEDFDNGLYSGEGQSLVGWGLRKGLGLGGLLARGTAAYVGGTYGLMWKTAKWTAQKLVDQFTNVDAYLPGDEEPRIRSVLMKKGFYRDKDGAPIFSLKDIKGPVFDVDGREIVSQEEIDKYKSFFTRNGSLLFTVGRAGINLGVGAAQLAGRAAKAYGKLALSFYKGLWKGTKAIGRGIGGLGKRMLGKGGKSGIGVLDDEMAMAAVEIQGQQLTTQQAILAFMRSKWDKEGVHGDSDGDGVRDFSWQDIVRRRKERAEGKATAEGDNGDVVEAIDKLGKRLDKNFKHLEDVTEEAGESSWLEDAADLSELRGEKGGRKGKVGRAKPKGRIGRWAGKLGDGLKSVARRVPGAGAIGRVAASGGRLAMAALPAVAEVGGGALLSGASAVGGALLTGGAAIASGAATAATAVVSAIGLPVLLGVGAVAGIGYLGYRWYKSDQAKNFPLLYLRMTQYGVAPTDQERVEKMIKLEGLCRKGVTIAQDGTASIDASSIDVQALLKLFSITDAEQQDNMYKWLSRRFRPVFLAHCTAMQRILNTTDLASADQGIGDGDIDTFLGVVDQGGLQDVYNDTDTSPFDSDLNCDADDVADAVKMVKARRKDRTEQTAKAAALGVAVGSAEQVAKNTTVTVSAGGTGNSDDIARGLTTAASGRSGLLSGSYTSAAPARTNATSLDIPTAARYKAYGLVELNLARCQQLQKVEEVYWGVIQYSGTSKAVMGGDQDALEQKVMDIFKPATEDIKSDTVRWLNYRFIPVMLQYAISVRRRYNGDARDGARNLTGPAMHEVLDEMSRASTTTMTGDVSVWSVTNTPWPGVPLETMPGSIKQYMDALNTQDTSKVLNVTGMESQKRVQGAQATYAQTLTNTALGNTRSSAASPGVGITGPTLANLGKVYSGKQQAGGAAGTPGDGSLLMGGPKGQTVQHPGGGTGGDINSLPDAKGKGYEAMGPLIAAAAKMVGFDPVIANNVAGIESRWNPNASSGIANGLFQFVGGTWRDMIAKYGAQYGISPMASPMDPRANAILGACYLKENYDGLSSTLGGNVSDVDLYTAHFLGLGGAKRFLTAPRNEPASNHVSEAAVRNNASVFMANGRIRTVGETIAELDRRMNASRKAAGNPLSPTGVQPTPTDVPSGATPSDTAPANPTPGASGGMETPEGGATQATDAPETVGAAMAAIPTAATVASAANAGASGTPTNGAPVGIMPMSSVSAPPEASGPVIPSVIAGAAAATATRAAATAQQNNTVAQQASTVEGIAPALAELVQINTSMDGSLKAIKQLIEAMGSGNTRPAAPVVASSQPEPMARTPLNGRRENAVT